MATRKKKLKTQQPSRKIVANFYEFATDKRRRWKRRITAIREIIHEHLANLIPRPHELVSQTVSTIQSEVVNTLSCPWRFANKIERISNGILRWWAGSNKISSTDIAKLPPELVIQIVASMNLSVCSMVNTFPRSWLSIMAHPYFCLIQNSRDHSGSWGSRSSLSLIFGNATDKFPNGYTLLQKDTELDILVSIKLKLDDFDIKNYRSTDFFNPCNGLLRVHTCDLRDKESYYICNPLIGEWVMLPDSDPRKHVIVLPLVGFGYSSNTNQYKLVRLRVTLSDFGTHSVFGEVYTVGGNCGGWRRIEDDSMLQTLFLGNRYVGGPPVALNSILHWLNTSDRIHYQVICFDVGTERLESFAVPNTAGYCVKYIRVLHGCFIAWNFRLDGDGKYCQLWVLKDYSVKALLHE